MILVLAKAAGCSWTTVKELLLMYVAERNLQSGRSGAHVRALQQADARDGAQYHQFLRPARQKRDAENARLRRNRDHLASHADGRLPPSDYYRPSCERMPQLRPGGANLSFYLWQSVTNTGS